MHVIHEPTDLSFERAGVKGKVFTQDLTNRAGFLLIETNAGHETTIIEHECDFIYYILGGNGHFEIDGTKEDCTRGDLVVVPAGSKFTYKGRLRMLLTTTPLWNESQEEVL